MTTSLSLRFIYYPIFIISDYLTFDIHENSFVLEHMNHSLFILRDLRAHVMTQI